MRIRIRVRIVSSVFIPVRARNISTNDAIIMAPWISLILICHSFVFSSASKLDRFAGHFHLGKLIIASDGTRYEKLPPCTIGNVFPTVLCKMVIIPDMKISVEIMMALSGSSSSMQSAGVKRKGIATADVIISKLCCINNRNTFGNIVNLETILILMLSVVLLYLKSQSYRYVPWRNVS